ncbi:hypothetical protein [Marinobacter adhaerens]|uniref:hypothetical protein n=1 Tax=Marinobacter adhaerens TaxID=1033846 RepID=UPI001E65BB19|nr:hypothetical protein [Marinobacter adhaerens]
MKDKPVNKAGSVWMPGGLIPVEQWKVPETSVRRSLKDALRHALAQIRAGVVAEKEVFESLDNLPELSAARLESFAPRPDPSVLAEVLSRALVELGLNHDSGKRVALLVAPPFSGIRSALECFPELELQQEGEAGRWSLILPPENLLLDEQGAREWWDTQDLSRPWVIPELADFWLRHLSGLALVRELLRRVAAGGTAPGAIGCSSWCWQFWSSYFRDAHFSPMTPSPMAAVELGEWFESLAAGDSDYSITARMADDGLWVLPMTEGNDGKKRKHSGFLRDLASVARGNPGVALAIWRRALRDRPEEEAGTEESGPGSSDGGSVTRAWVIPFDQLGLPAVPQSQGDNIGLLLHALLLHDGLDASHLQLVTGVAEHEAGFVLARLARADLIEQQSSGGRWQVTAQGYPSIRRHLQSWGFPVDTF